MENVMTRRDGYIMITISWILFSLFGSLPTTSRAYPLFYRFLLRDHVRLYDNRNNRNSGYRGATPRTALLAQPYTMDRRFGDSFLYGCSTAHIRSRRCTSVCSRGHRPQTEQAASAHKRQRPLDPYRLPYHNDPLRTDSETLRNGDIRQHKPCIVYCCNRRFLTKNTSIAYTIRTA